MARRTPTIGISLLLVGTLLPAVGTARESKATCFGKPATILGTEGRDILEGTSGPDVIIGLGGRDDIDGRGGADLLCSGSGAGSYTDDDIIGERVRGGSGDDLIDGGPGPNDLSGGSGDDSIKGSSGVDAILGGGGNDSIRALAGSDFVNGGPGKDAIRYGEGSDGGYGADGNDHLLGGPGNDALGSQRDFACGGGDILDCDPGRPSEAGKDRIYGGLGRDLIAVGLGSDILNGGPGIDHAVFSSFDPSSTFLGDLNEQSAASAETGIDSLVAFERLSAFSRGDITLIGDDGNNHLGGGVSAEDGGEALFVGGNGNDTFQLDPPISRGEAGPVAIQAGEGNDVAELLACSGAATPTGPVTHSLDMGPGDDSARGSCVDDTISGGEGNDVLLGDWGIDTIDGGPGDDMCEGELVSNCEP